MYNNDVYYTQLHITSNGSNNTHTVSTGFVHFKHLFFIALNMILT